MGLAEELTTKQGKEELERTRKVLDLTD